MNFHLNIKTGLVQSFPVPTGDDWIEMHDPQPAPHYIAKVVDGVGVWVEPAEDVAEARERARAVMNPLRDTFLNRLSGIAMFSEEPGIKEHCAQLRSALLDITKNQEFLDATTYQEMEYALLISYKNIALSAQDAVRNVFRELEV